MDRRSGWQSYFEPSPKGTFNHSGGTNSAYSLTLGQVANTNSAIAVPTTSTFLSAYHASLPSTGIYNLSGTGVLNVISKEAIGYGGIGQFVQTGGSNTTNWGVVIGELTGSSGSYSLQGGTLSSPFERVGHYGSGSFYQGGGTNTTGTIEIARYGGAGSYTLAGGTLNVGSFQGGGAGTFNYNGGTLNLRDTTFGAITSYFMKSRMGTLGIATTSGSSASWSYNPSLFTFNNLRVGSGGTGEFLHGGNQSLSLGDLTVGSAVGSSGTYTLNSGALSAVNERIGINSSGLNIGTGVFNQNGGSNTVTNDLTLLLYGSYNLAGGTLNVGGNVVGSNYIYSKLTQSAGTLDVTGNIGRTRVQLDGGMLSVGGSIRDYAAIYHNGGTLNVTGGFTGPASTTASVRSALPGQRI